jgi:hypothetical protein
MSESLAVFVCGTPKDHVCDDSGPIIYFLSNGETTHDRAVAERRGCSGVSVTCSVCGLLSMERSVWEGP